MIKIRMAGTTECDYVLWVLLLLEVDQTMCEGFMKLGRS